MTTSPDPDAPARSVQDEAAAGTTAARLTADEAARLAGMVPNPVYYQAHPQDRNLRHRTRIIRRNMHTAQIP